MIILTLHSISIAFLAAELLKNKSDARDAELFGNNGIGPLTDESSYVAGLVFSLTHFLVRVSEALVTRVSHVHGAEIFLFLANVMYLILRPTAIKKLYYFVRRFYTFSIGATVDPIRFNQFVSLHNVAPSRYSGDETYLVYRARDGRNYNIAFKNIFDYVRYLSFLKKINRERSDKEIDDKTKKLIDSWTKDIEEYKNSKLPSWDDE